jgi:arginine utilization protein RocB
MGHETPKTPLAASAATWALELTGWPSVNGTADEAAFAPRLRDKLATRPMLTGRADRVWTIPVPQDPLGRASVAALVPGSGARTVLLTGHFDTVRTDDYGDLQALALQPTALRAALLERLEDGSAGSTEALARTDLRGGAFLPGRGLLDMKAGLAAGLAALEAWAVDGSAREGNLLFLAVPDEEASSAGARSAARALPAQLAARGLTLEAAINLDALLDDGDGAQGRCVALGTVGKLLPSALVVGRPAHAANALGGLNAGALMAAIVAEVEWAAALTERADGETAAPPTLLGLSDHRPAYDVTTPERVWAYWNVMTLGRDPAEVLDRFAALARRALARSLRSLRGRAGGRRHELETEVPVLTFAELRREVGGRVELAGMAREVAARGLDLPEQCRLITERLWAASGRTGAGVVIGLASMPYLPARLEGEPGARLKAAAQRAARRVAARHGTSIGFCGYFPGISDMSFLGQVDAAAVPAIAANTPAWGAGIDWPEGDPSLGVPTVNIGPWGRDYHTPLERLHAPYAFEVLPELLLATVREILAGGDAQACGGVQR